MAAQPATATGLSEAEHNRQLRRALLASTVGTTIEWYDFLLYGTVTGLVFGRLLGDFGRIRKRLKESTIARIVISRSLPEAVSPSEGQPSRTLR